MNKLNKAFDKLHASKELKDKTYQKIKERMTIGHDYKKKYILFLPLIFTCICCFLILYVYNDNDIDKDADKDVNLMSTEANKCSSDELLYKGHIYIIDDDRSKVSLNNELGTLNQVNNVLSNNFDSFCHNGASLYSIKDSTNLAILDNDNILVYILKK